MTRNWDDVVWANCPYCAMQFLNLSADQITAHTVACAQEKQKEMHPEVLDFMYEDYRHVQEVENKLDDEQLWLGDDPEKDDPEVDDDHESHK